LSWLTACELRARDNRVVVNTKALDKHFARITEGLHPGEEVVSKLSATITTDLKSTSGTISGALVATSERLVFSGSGLLQQDSRSFPWPQVSSLDLAQGMLLAHITVTAATSVARFMVGKTDDTKAFVATAQELMVKSRAAAAQPAPAAGSSTADELAKLAGLRDQGILTDEEFSAAKARLLGA
jgi:hypothetical protein